MHRQTRNELCGIISEDERYDARAHNPLADIAATRDKCQPVVMECSCPDERTAMPRKGDAELRAADARCPAHQSSWNHCQQKRATCVFSRGTKRAKNTRTDDHAGGHERGCGPYDV